MKIKAAVIRQMGLTQPYADSKPLSIEEVELDLHDDKLKLAKELGATDTVNAKDPDAIQKVRDLTAGATSISIAAECCR